LPLCDPAENLIFRHDKNEPAIQLKQDHCLHPVHQFVSHLFVCFATLVSIAKGTILPFPDTLKEYTHPLQIVFLQPYLYVPNCHLHRKSGSKIQHVKNTAIGRKQMGQSSFGGGVPK
jgi:hypothetical protein